MTVSQACLDVIKKFEGLRLNPYCDLAGLWTVGFGHKMTAAELADGGHDRAITQPDALRLLIDDADWAADQVARLVHVPLTQGQFDALVDFTYNLGAARLESSTLLKMLNLGNYSDAGQQLLLWDRVGQVRMGGLALRRQAELSLWGS